ncbi:MAG: c-type cytochrome [Vicinamibacterales bacterium]|jgi:mono/diheme cytochrome c family protein
MLAIFAGGIGGAAAQAAPAPSGAAAADKGAAVYAAQKCTMCHALDGKGNAKGALDGVGTKLTAVEIRQWIVTPVEMAAKAQAQAARKPAMKAFATLPKEDLDALVAFLAAKKKK